MDRIFHSIDIKHKICSELNLTNSELVIVSAFCKIDALVFLDSRLKNKSITKNLLVRFRLDDLLAGATDIGLFRYCMEKNWNLYFDLNLHSKIYVFDNHRVILGSPNLTLSGLGIEKAGNIESVVYINDATKSEIDGIQKIFNQAIEMNDIIFSEMEKQYSEYPPKQMEKPKWPESISSLFKKEVFHLWTTEMFFSESPRVLEEHDRALLGLDNEYSLEDIKTRFNESKAFLWLKTCLLKNTEMYFGALTAELHNALLDDPKPYRKEVKTLLTNLLRWSIELNVEQVLIDRPNYSQRVRIMDKNLA